MFNNQIFESWLTKMSDDILSKVNREKITTEEMIILILKAQTNHFHHMDEDLNKNISDSRAENQRGIHELRIETKKSIDDLREETKKSIDDLREETKKSIDDLREETKKSIDDLREETKKSIDETQKRIAETKKSINDLREEFREDFHRLDQKLDSRFMWSTGITITLSLGLYLKLFLG